MGHTGTLDPEASGVLLACVGRATKVAQFLSGCDKDYDAKIRLGVIVDSFKGKIWQRPPMHSAIRYQGKRLYQYARAKQEVQIEKREVEIKRIEVVDINMPYVELRISCSKGTYVRSIAFDIGQRLGCGAYLSSLRRTRVGRFTLRQALDLERISEIEAQDRIQDVLIPIETALAHLPSVVVKEDFAQRIRHGVPLLSPSVLSTEKDFEQNQTISIRDVGEKVIAIGKALCPKEKFLDLDWRDKLFEYIRVI
jgi:tRNA pseudouridine55 synthase